MSWHLDDLTWYPKNLHNDTILSRTVRWLLNLQTAFPSSVYHFWVTLSADKSFMRDIMTRPYMAVASGSLGCNSLSVDGYFLLTNSMDG